MPDVLILGPQAEQFQMLLEPMALPALNAHYCRSAEAACVHAADVDVIFGPPATVAGLLPQCRSLRWVQSTWAGVRPLIDQPQHNFMLTGVKDIFGELMREYVLAWLLGIERRVIDRGLARSWDPRPDASLVGRRLGILGTGSIGRDVAAACRVLGLHVVGVNTSGASVEGFNRCYRLSERLEFAHDLDYLVSVLPDTEQTNNVIDAQLLTCLRNGAIVINAGRANAVVLPDLVAAVRAGKVRAAVLDVLPIEPLADVDPLWDEPNLFITSHTAAPTLAQRVVDVFASNYRAYIDGRPLEGVVDFSRGY